MDSARNYIISKPVKNALLYSRAFLFSKWDFLFKGIFLSIEQKCGNLDYEGIQDIERLKMHHLSKH